ncbi:helix-turn-helix domain-containing protein [Roseomonas sp. BN140053]|uniref:helix-turn-helix domain-containing protein n=1 Tax=Roseomonas sp. BN140053 TaxID=3391898 RepID=UPI0039EB3084
MPATKDKDRVPGPVAAILEELMAARGLSARALSEAAGGPPDTVRNILRGRSQHPRSDTLEGLARVLGVSLGVLTGAEPLPSPDDARPSGSVPASGDIEIREVAFAAAATAPSAAPSPQPTGSAWRIPADVLAGRGGDGQLVLMQAPHDLEDIRRGDRLLLDLGQRLPSPPGVFVTWDGIGPSLARLRVAPSSSEGLRVRFTGDGTDEVVEFGDLEVLGRVAGRWIWSA